MSENINRIEIKPLSVNQCWQGKRFKTKKYKIYERQLISILPDLQLPEPPFSVYYRFGFSSSASDIDNPIKPLQDILQKRYGFDDKNIHELNVRKEKVKKGGEFLEFSIKSLNS